MAVTLNPQSLQELFAKACSAFVQQQNLVAPELLLTFDEYYKKYYVPSKAHAQKESTKQTQAYIYNNRLKATFGHVRMIDINKRLISEWQLNQLTKVSPIRINGAHIILNAVLGHARIKFDLSTDYKIPKLQFHSKPRAFWMQEEFNAVLEQIEDESVCLALSILFYCGLRLGELFALRPIAFRRQNYLLSVELQRQRLCRPAREIVSEPKYDSKRTIAVPPDLFIWIEQYIQDNDIQATDWIFNFPKNILPEAIRRGADRAGVHRVTIHGLRHSHASMLINGGVPVLVVANRLGHHNPAITLKTYSHLYQNSDVEVVRNIKIERK